jgi:hypothetical protein
VSSSAERSRNQRDPAARIDQLSTLDAAISTAASKATESN